MRILAVLLFLYSGVVSAQPADVMPVRNRITPANAADVSLYMMLSRRADRVMWSPGASLLAVVDSTDIDLFSVTDWLVTPLHIRLDSVLTDMVFGPDGQVLYTLTPGSVVAWATVDGSVKDRFIADARRISVNADGTRLALLSRQNLIQVITVATRETFTVTPTVIPDDVAFSRDGRSLFVSDAKGGGEIIDLALRRSEVTLTGGDAPPTASLVNSAVYSSDGRVIISQASDDSAALWLWDARKGENSGVMTRPAEYQRIYGWGQNTRANIAIGAAVGMTPERSAVLIWALNGGEALARLRHPGVRDAQPSPDGTLIASVGGGTLRLWAAAESLSAPEELAQLSQVNVVAACDVFNVKPSLGQLLAGQTVSLVWSWYAASAPLVRDYLDAAIVRLDLDGAAIRPWIFVSQTVNDAVNDGNPTVYLYAPVGSFSLGEHSAQVTVTWVTPINDGFTDFGPGTANLSDGGACRFAVR